MQYPGEVMTKKEIMKIKGITAAMIDRAYREPTQRFIWKSDPTRSNSTMYIDTAKFEEWRMKDIERQIQAARRRTGIVA